MTLKLPGIIVTNSEMIDKEGVPQKSASILPDAIMVHPDMINTLIDGIEGMFNRADFRIMTTEEYRKYINETYPDKKEGTERVQKKTMAATE